MIDYYGYITTMSWRAVIALEELELPYRAHSIVLGKGEQKSPEHLARNPFGRVPVIVDHDPGGGKGGDDPVTVFESGAILLYLADKTGRLKPKDPDGAGEFYRWFFWIVTGYGAALGESAYGLESTAYGPQSAPTSPLLDIMYLLGRIKGL
jgi:GST-like protein